MSDQQLLEVLLDSWDRNNTILVNLLRNLPEGGLLAKALDGSPSVAELFTHVHYVRFVFVSEDAPEFTKPLPEEEWRAVSIENWRARLLHCRHCFISVSWIRVSPFIAMTFGFERPDIFIQ